VDQATAPAEDRRIGVLYLDSREKGTLLANPTRSALETLATEAAVAIENAQLYRRALENARLEQEMRTAAEIQRALLPTRTRLGPFFDAAAETMPCRSIGGDFFDYIDLPDGRFGFALGDVAGKGPPAALLAAMLQGTLAAQAFASAGPAATLRSVNTALVRRGIQARFVTLFYGVLAPDGRLTYCNAGHNPPLLVGRRARVSSAAAAAWPAGVTRLDQGGPIIGLFEDIGFDEETLTLEPGDFLVMFSDGVSEALNPSEEEFGDERILRSVEGLGEDAQRRLGGLFDAVSRFAGDAAQHDDVTAMVVVYRGT
jgi:sigma-B regulation protein RsbU (phosphoserine phosphatase)